MVLAYSSITAVELSKIADLVHEREIREKTWRTRRRESDSQKRKALRSKCASQAMHRDWMCTWRKTRWLGARERQCISVCWRNRRGEPTHSTVGYEWEQGWICVRSRRDVCESKAGCVWGKKQESACRYSCSWRRFARLLVEAVHVNVHEWRAWPDSSYKGMKIAIWRSRQRAKVNKSQALARSYLKEERQVFLVACTVFANFPCWGKLSPRFHTQRCPFVNSLNFQPYNHTPPRDQTLCFIEGCRVSHKSVSSHLQSSLLRAKTKTVSAGLRALCVRCWSMKTSLVVAFAAVHLPKIQEFHLQRRNTNALNRSF